MVSKINPELISPLAEKYKLDSIERIFPQGIDLPIMFMMDKCCN
jgi:hypothetical protein